MEISTKIPWYVSLSLCTMMLGMGALTYLLTSVPRTNDIGTFYGVFCIIVLAAVGIYHRRRVNDKKETD